MKRVEVASYPVSIFIAGSVWQAETTCMQYAEEVGFCATVTETAYCHTSGYDPGVVVGLIHYPRFPSTPDAIWAHAEALAARLCRDLKQQSYTIQAPDKTVWFSHRPEDATLAQPATREDALSIVLPNDMGRAEVRRDAATFSVWVVDPSAHGGEYRSVWNLPTFEEAVRNIMDVIWPGCLPFAAPITQLPTSDDELASTDPVQIAFDQQTDDPPGDWNDACQHIANKIRAALSDNAKATPEDGE